MSAYRWPNAPSAIRQQLDGVRKGLDDALGEDLLGLYLHGSLTFGSFNSELSDIDLLAVARRKRTLEEKAGLAALFAELSGGPAKLEFHLLAEPELHPWRHPMPYDFHWGESLREAFRADLADALSQQHAGDPDLAAHLTVTLRHGIALVGPPPEDLLPGVPWDDYVESLIADLAWILDSEWPNALYRALSPARIWATIATGQVQSKDSGAAWALERLPHDVRAPLAQALAHYRGERATFEPDADEFARYTAHVVAEIRSIASR